MVGRWLVGRWLVGDWQVVGGWSADHLLSRLPTTYLRCSLFNNYPSRGFLLNGHNFRFRLTFLDFDVVL